MNNFIKLIVMKMNPKMSLQGLYKTFFTFGENLNFEISYKSVNENDNFQ